LNNSVVKFFDLDECEAENAGGTRRFAETMENAIKDYKVSSLMRLEIFTYLHDIGQKSGIISFGSTAVKFFNSFEGS
jgi:hypothetical protein